MDPWIGPAIVAAAVSGMVSVLGWFVASWQAVRLEQRRRAEIAGEALDASLSNLGADPSIRGSGAASAARAVLAAGQGEP